jgi:hypothetical protein
MKKTKEVTIMHTFEPNEVKLYNMVVHSFTPEQLAKLGDIHTGYQLRNIPDGKYYYIQLKREASIQRANKSFSSKTIFFLPKKDEVTAHYYLAELLLQLTRDDLLTAGQFEIEGQVLKLWNCKSGAYWRTLHLDDPKKATEVGLPIAKFVRVDDKSLVRAADTPAITNAKATPVIPLTPPMTPVTSLTPPTTPTTGLKRLTL